MLADRISRVWENLGTQRVWATTLRATDSPAPPRRRRVRGGWRVYRRALVFSALLALGAAVAAPASASSDHGNKPPGNNGTIKIDGYPMDGGNGNDPHVGCPFSVNFFGYDGGTQSAQLVFEAHAPTKGGTLETDNTSWTLDRRTSGNQLDKHYGPVDLINAFKKA